MYESILPVNASIVYTWCSVQTFVNAKVSVNASIVYTWCRVQTFVNAKVSVNILIETRALYLVSCAFLVDATVVVIMTRKDERTSAE